MELLNTRGVPVKSDQSLERQQLMYNTEIKHTSTLLSHTLVNISLNYYAKNITIGLILVFALVKIVPISSPSPLNGKSDMSSKWGLQDWTANTSWEHVIFTLTEVDLKT